MVAGDLDKSSGEGDLVGAGSRGKGQDGGTGGWHQRRAGGQGARGLPAERPPDVSLISGTASETLSCEPGASVPTC